MSGISLEVQAVKHNRQSVSIVMAHVLIALLPGIIVYALLIDARVLKNIAIAVVIAILCEAAMLALRRRPVIATLKDCSIAVAAALLVLSLPQSLPTWQLIVGIIFMCSLGKHVFGGLGHNPFNPAMLAYAVLIISFPQTMTQWSTELGLLDTVPVSWDAITSATPLERLDTELQDSLSEVRNVTHINRAFATDVLKQSNWTLLAITWLIGGMYLLAVKVINWRIPVSVLGTLWLAYLAYGSVSASIVIPATMALFTGALVFGAFFIATDPVSCAASNPGKIFYGCGIGLLCFFIREFSHYPEGFAFAVLLMNMCVPLIDHTFVRNTLRVDNVKRDSK